MLHAWPHFTALPASLHPPSTPSSDSPRTVCVPDCQQQPHPTHPPSPSLCSLFSLTPAIRLLRQRWASCPARCWWATPRRWRKGRRCHTRASRRPAPLGCSAPMARWQGPARWGPWTTRETRVGLAGTFWPASCTAFTVVRAVDNEMIPTAQPGSAETERLRHDCLSGQQALPATGVAEGCRLQRGRRAGTACMPLCLPAPLLYVDVRVPVHQTLFPACVLISCGTSPPSEPFSFACLTTSPRPFPWLY